MTDTQNEPAAAEARPAGAPRLETIAHGLILFGGLVASIGGRLLIAANEALREAADEHEIQLDAARGQAYSLGRAHERAGVPRPGEPAEPATGAAQAPGAALTGLLSPDGAAPPAASPAESL